MKSIHLLLALIVCLFAQAEVCERSSLRQQPIGVFDSGIGGLWTAAALSLVYRFGWLPVLVFCAVMLLMWSLCAFFLASPTVRAHKR